MEVAIVWEEIIDATSLPWWDIVACGGVRLGFLLVCGELGLGNGRNGWK